MPDEYKDLDQQVAAVYRHPSGKTITVYGDDTFVCRDASGKHKPTSATAEKLRAGYGRWYEIEDPETNPIEGRRVE